MDVLKSQNADSERRQRSYTGVGSLAASVRVVRSTAAFSQQRLLSETRLNGHGFEAGIGVVPNERPGDSKFRIDNRSHFSSQPAVFG